MTAAITNDVTDMGHLTSIGVIDLSFILVRKKLGIGAISFHGVKVISEKKRTFVKGKKNVRAYKTLKSNGTMQWLQV